MHLSAKAKQYLLLIGKTQDASVVLTRGFSKAAGELKSLGLAIFIPVASGGSHVALTQEGVEEYEKLTSSNP